MDPKNTPGKRNCLEPEMLEKLNSCNDYQFFSEKLPGSCREMPGKCPEKIQDISGTSSCLKNEQEARQESRYNL